MQFDDFRQRSGTVFPLIYSAILFCRRCLGPVAVESFDLWTQLKVNATCEFSKFDPSRGVALASAIQTKNGSWLTVLLGAIRTTSNWLFWKTITPHSLGISFGLAIG